jgi:hypothetical protein
MTTSYEDKSEDRNTTTSEQKEQMKEQVEAIKQDAINHGGLLYFGFPLIPDNRFTEN